MNKLASNINLFNEEYTTSYPNAETPVCYDNLNNVISRFKDDVWDFSYYIPSLHYRKKIYFNCFDFCQNIKLKNLIIYEYKLIIYGLIYCNVSSSRSTSIQTLLTCYTSKLRILFYLAIECNVSLSNISKNEYYMKKLFNNFSLLERKECNRFISLLNKLAALSFTFKNHNFSLTNNQINFIEKLSKLLKNNVLKQHLVIPSNLYLNLSIFIDENLEEFQNNSVFILDQYNHNITGNYSKKIFIEKKFENYCSKHNIKSSSNIDSQIRKIINLALTKLIMFSGMRHGEALLLPFNCLEIISLNNNPIYTITGYTTKYTKSGPMKATWITSPQVKIAIDVLQSITNTYLKSSKINLESINYNKVPLSTYISKQSKHYSKAIYDYPMLSALSLKDTLISLNFNSNVDANAMRELELSTSSFISLEKYNIEIGKEFPFTPHQFRRSLTVYAARSGMVNIPALKGQLKHIKNDMTLFYANNAMNSFNLFDNELVDSFNDELVLDQYLNYKQDVLDAIDPLFGAEGSRLQNAKDSESIPLFIEDEKIALKNIKEGKMSYRRTPLGGCVKIGSCDEIAELSVTSCISCKDAIFSDRTDKALRIALRSFQNQLNSLPKNSPYTTYLTAEINQINSLLTKRNQVLEIIKDAK